MGDYKIVTFLFLFVCFGFVFVFVFFFWQTPNSLFCCSANRAKCVTSAGYGALNLYKT